MKQYAKHPGEVIRNELQARGILLGRFAEHVGLSGPHVGEILRGTRNLSVSNAHKFGRALGIDPRELWRLQADYEFSKVDAAGFKGIKEI